MDVGPAFAPPLLVVVALAELLTTPQVADVVGEVRWTCLLAPAASVPKLQVSTPVAIEQPLSELAASIAQFKPVLAGSVSLTVTPVRSEERRVGLLLSVTTYPIEVPALTVP